MTSDIEIWLAAYCASIAGAAGEVRHNSDVKYISVNATRLADQAVESARAARKPWREEGGRE